MINKELEYSISEGNNARKFDIDSETGEITIIDTIDYEEDPTLYNLTILANNTAAPYLTGEDMIQVYISVRNMQNYILSSDQLLIANIYRKIRFLTTNIHPAVSCCDKYRYLQ